MKKYVTATFLAALVPSCVFPSDIAAISEANDRYAQEVTEALKAIGEEGLTKEEAKEIIEDSAEKRDATLHEIHEAVEARTEAAGSAIENLPTDPLGLLVTLASLATTGYITYNKVNKDRDSKRVKRNEPV